MVVAQENGVISEGRVEIPSSEAIWGCDSKEVALDDHSFKNAVESHVEAIIARDGDIAPHVVMVRDEEFVVQGIPVQLLSAISGASLIPALISNMRVVFPMLAFVTKGIVSEGELSPDEFDEAGKDVIVFMYLGMSAFLLRAPIIESGDSVILGPWNEDGNVAGEMFSPPAIWN